MLKFDQLQKKAFSTFSPFPYSYLNYGGIRLIIFESIFLPKATLIQNFIEIGSSSTSFRRNPRLEPKLWSDRVNFLHELYFCQNLFQTKFHQNWSRNSHSSSTSSRRKPKFRPEVVTRFCPFAIPTEPLPRPTLKKKFHQTRLRFQFQFQFIINFAYKCNKTLP